MNRRTQRIPAWARSGRAKWRYTGSERPAFAHVPGEGQRSVWDLPRPPLIEGVELEVTVHAEGREVASTRAALRVLETGSPPTYYLPPGDVDRALLVAAVGSSLCEWKGEAHYWDLVLNGEAVREVAWSYPAPFPEFESIRDHFSFYPARVACFVDGVRVAPQPGGFYGGWVTPEWVGPFKGEPGVGSL